MTRCRARGGPGFRPCKRCNPDGRSSEAENATLVTKAGRIIEDSEEEPSLKVLSEAVRYSRSYFHRIFKMTTGLTSKDYAATDRARKVRDGLCVGNSVTEAIYDAGFNSSGRFYEKSTGMLGMTPTRFRAGGVNEEIKFAIPIPCHRVVGNGGALSGYAWGVDRKRTLLKREAAQAV